VTLIELLVVIAIIVILAAAMLPLMQPALRGRDTREAARQFNTFLMGAQARAAQRGRPVGVWLERNPASTAGSFRMYVAEVPPPYAGETFSARVTITHLGGPPATQARADFLLGCCAGATPPMVQVGDLIRIDYRGPLYRITSVTAGTSVTFQLAGSGDQLPPAIAAPGVPFQIYRYPRKTAAAPLELPPSSSIDLSLSGVGSAGTELAAGTTPVIILFNPSGYVDRIISSGYTGRPAGTVHFLVGRSDQIAGLNLSDLSNIWVSVGHQSGLIVSTASAGGADVASARQIARSAQSIGGR